MVLAGLVMPLGWGPRAAGRPVMLRRPGESIVVSGGSVKEGGREEGGLTEVAAERVGYGTGEARHDAGEYRT